MSKLKQAIRIGVATGLMGVTGVSSAVAEEMDNVAATASTDDIGLNNGARLLEEIVVTARKRPELLGRTPLAIVAETGDQLRERGLGNLEAIANATPGVSLREDVAGRAGPSITIRGVGFDDYHAGGSPSTAVNIDQVYQGSNAWITGQLFDLDRVEILKGPQGTLYGHNTTAGAINVLTRQPTDTAVGFLDAQYGSYNALKIEGAVSGPLTQELTGRIAFDRESGGGFLQSKGNAAYAGYSPVPGTVPPLPLVAPEKDFGDKDFWGVRGILAYTPTQGTRLSLTVNYARDRGANSQTDVSGKSATGFTEPDNDPYTFYANVLPFIHSDEEGTRLSLEQDIGWATFTGIASQQHLQRDYSLDPGSPLRAFDILYRDQLDQTSLEARPNSRDTEPVSWVVGSFYFQDRIASGQTEDVSDLYQSVIEQQTVQHRNSVAAFAEADWLFLPTWTATLGARYTNEYATFRGDVVDLNPYGVSRVSTAFSLPVLFAHRYENDDVSGRAVLTYRPTPANTAYLSVSRGYKSGGFDGATIFTADKALPFKPERMWAYESGYKWFPETLPMSVTASVFYYDITGLQATAVKTISGITTNVRTNVASAIEYGEELQAVIRPVTALQLTGSVALLHSEITHDDSANAQEIARREGGPLPNAPTLSYTASADYTYRLPRNWSLIPAVHISYTGSEYKELDHYLRNSGYLLLDARVGLMAPSDHWSVSVYGRNLTDKVYYVGLIPAVSRGSVIGTQRIVGTPRTFGVDIAMHF